MSRLSNSSSSIYTSDGDDEVYDSRVSVAETITFSPALNHLLQGSTSTSPTTTTSLSIGSAASTNTGISPTANTEPNRTTIMKDIDHIIHSYQGLDRCESGIKRDTWAILNGNDSCVQQRNTLNLNREALELLKNMPSKSCCGHGEKQLEYPTLQRERSGSQRYICSHTGPISRPQLYSSKEGGDVSASLTFNINLFGSQPYLRTYWRARQEPEPEFANEETRDARSIGSSVYSNRVPGSLYSHEPNEFVSKEEFSPHTSFASGELPVSVPNSIREVPSLWALDTQVPPTPPPKDLPPMNLVGPRPRTAPSAPPEYTFSPAQPRFAGAPKRHGRSIRTKKGKLKVGHTRIHILPDSERPSLSSSKATKTGIAKIAALFTRSSSSPISTRPAQPSTSGIRLNTHLAVSTSCLPTPTSSFSRSPSSFRLPQSLSQITLTSPKPTTLLPFCKGAWAIRNSSTDLRRSLTLQSLPDGLYNTHQVWQCKECRFKGGVSVSPGNQNDRTAAPPGLRNRKKKKGRKEEEEPGIDNEVYTSAVGIRYRWIFLAKSHVRKKSLSLDSPAQKPSSFYVGVQRQPPSAYYSSAVSDPPSNANGTANFGCIFCSVGGRESGVYGNVETLMSHIFLEHAREMEEGARMEIRCVVGRVAEKGEEWDLNIPF